MKFLLKIFAWVKEHIGLLSLLFLSILIGGLFPSTYWSFVDDGELIEVSQRMSATLNLLGSGHLLTWLHDPQVGRFRPFYWLYHWLVYTQFGVNHAGHATIQLSLILFTVVALYFTALKITKKKVAGFFAGLLFVANTLNQENWYRLGPQEAPLVLFLSLTVLFIFSYIDKSVSLDKETFIFKDLWSQFLSVIKNIIPGKADFKTFFKFNSRLSRSFFILAFVFVFPAYLMKESSIAFLVFPVLLYLWSLIVKPIFSKTVKVQLFLFMLWNIVLAGLARYGAYVNYKTDSYASDYIVTYANIRSNFTGYYHSIWITFEPLLIVVGIYLIFKTVLFLFSSHKSIANWACFNFIILFTGLTFFAIQLPWQYEIPRYLLPTMYFFALFMGITLSDVIVSLKSLKGSSILEDLGFKGSEKFLAGVVWFLVLIGGIYNLLMMGQYVSRIYLLTNNFNKPLLSYLAREVGQNGRVVMDTPPGTALELRQEIGLHLGLFFDRNDVKAVYFSGSRDLHPGDVLLRAGEFKQVSTDKDFLVGQLSGSKRIDIHIENKLYYPPMQFLKNYMTKWFLDVVRNRDHGFNPILAESQDNYYWEIYKVQK